MREDLRYPNYDAVKKILNKIGVNTEERINSQDQDFEYTSCVLDELIKYIELYSKAETSEHEKRILGCYFMECLNEYLQVHSYEHPLQAKALNLMLSDIHIHESELEYWSTPYNSNSRNNMPIAKFLVK